MTQFKVAVGATVTPSQSRQFETSREPGLMCGSNGSDGDDVWNVLE